MKRIIALSLLLLFLLSTLIGCKAPPPDGGGTQDPDNGAFGDDLDKTGIYDGYFEADNTNISITCLSGTPDCYTIENGVLTFSGMSDGSIYAISGTLSGHIVIELADAYTFELELQGLSVVSEDAPAITVSGGDTMTLTAKKDFQNYIYDTREQIAEGDTEQVSYALFSDTDLVIGGKGALSVVSEHNKGIHSKDDLKVKNLTLSVVCTDNALKGNDSVTVEGGACTLIATRGDGIKTTNSDMSDKGHQRGTIHILGGTHTVYAACDGLDAAYDVIIEDASTVLNIYTDKYSNYSEEVTANSSDLYFIRFTSNAYQYSVKYSNSNTDVLWVNAEYHSAVSGGRTQYYYYSFPKHTEYESMQFFIYDSSMMQGQESTYAAASDLMTPNTSYDTFALSANYNGLYYNWTNYTTNIRDGMGGPGGFGGMQEGNSDKGDHSTKGVKASNSIQVTAGSITVKAYNDALHANAETVLENGQTPLGQIILSGGELQLFSNDDGIHADGICRIAGATVSITGSYEGIEGSQVRMESGHVYVVSTDDGINATSSSGVGIQMSGGELYVYAGGDGLDANSRTSYQGIMFEGGKCLVLSTSTGNSAIDTEQGYTYTNGIVIAMMPSGAMINETMHCTNFSNVGVSKTLSVKSGEYLTVQVANTSITLKMNISLSGQLIILGDISPDLKTSNTTSATLDEHGISWG